MKEKLKKIDNKWIRLIAMIIVFVNSVSVMMDKPILPFDNEQIVLGVSVVAMVVTEVWNHWKNNSYTQSAKEADVYLQARKNKLKK